MRRYALLLCLILSIAIGGHAFAVDDDDSATVEVLAGDDDSAPSPPASVEITDEEAVEAVTDLVDAAQTKNWVLLLSAMLTLVIFAFRRFNLLSKVPPRYLPTVAVVLGVAGDLLYSLKTGGAVSTTGVVIGLASVGIWELLLKHFLAQKKQSAQEPETTTE